MFQMNQKKFTTILIIAIIVAVVVGGYFVIFKKLGLIVQQATPISTVQDGTANWKTYRNDKYGVEVQYPSNWILPTPNSSNVCDDNIICEITIGRIPLPVNPGEDISFVVSLLIHPPKVLSENHGWDGFDPCPPSQKVSLTSGLQAERKQCAGIDGETDIFSIDKDGVKYQIVHNIGSAEANNIFEKIANSFRFLR